MAELLGSAVAQELVRLALLCGLLLVVGGDVALSWLLPMPAGATGGWEDEARRRAQRIARLSTSLLVVVVLVRIIQQASAFADTPGQWPSAVPLVLQHTMWGKGWLLQVLSIAVLRITAPGEGGWRRLARVAALGALVVSPALSGHAVGAPRLAVLAVVLDAAHVAAAGLWVGTLLVMTLAIVPLRGAIPAPSMLDVLRRFTPLALTAAGVVAASGAFSSWLHLESLAALWSTPYGRTLSLKLALMAGVAAAGAFNWRVATPRMAATGDRAPLARAVLAECALALALLVATSFLIVTPLPGEG